MTEEKLLTLFERALAAGDFDALEDLKDQYWEDFDTEELAFCAACRAGAWEYVDEFAPELDLNADGGFCPYLEQTDSPKVRGILLKNGARQRKAPEAERQDVRLGRGNVVEYLTPELHRRLFEDFLPRAGLTVKAVTLAVKARRAASLPIPKPVPPFASGDTIETLCEAFRVNTPSGALRFEGVEKPVDAPALAAAARELLKKSR